MTGSSKRRPTGLPAVLIALVDALALNVGHGVALLARFGLDIPEARIDGMFRLVPLTGVLLVALFVGFDLYRPATITAARSVSLLVRPLALTALVLALVMATTQARLAPRPVLFGGLLLGFLFVFAWRLFLVNMQNRLRGPDHVILVADTKLADDHDQDALIHRLAAMPRGHVAIDLVLDYRDRATIVERAEGADVIVVSPAIPQAERSDLASELLERETSILLIPTAFEVALTTGTRSLFHDLDGLELSSQGPSLATSMLKRLLDVVLAVLIGLAVLPVVVVLTALIRRESPGPGLFRQQRVGRGQRPFTMLKLRTMREDAEADTGPVFASHNDHRLTRLGRFLRLSRLDELPQLWNVVRGDMSLVGPRPERPEFVADFLEMIPGYRRRFQLRPGLTGLAQVSGGYDASASEKLRFDLFYCNRVSLLLDLRILIRTLTTVLTPSKAQGGQVIDLDLAALIEARRGPEAEPAVPPAPADVELSAEPVPVDDR